MNSNVGDLSRDLNEIELKEAFTAWKPPPVHVFEQAVLMAAEESGEYE